MNSVVEVLFGTISRKKTITVLSAIIAAIT
nr:unnamed protein product [Callosobruchus analis]